MNRVLPRDFSTVDRKARMKIESRGLPLRPAEGSTHVEDESTANMKRTWVGYGLPRDWMDREQGEGHEFLHEATQVKNIWVPTGE